VLEGRAGNGGPRELRRVARSGAPPPSPCSLPALLMGNDDNRRHVTRWVLRRIDPLLPCRKEAAR